MVLALTTSLGGCILAADDCGVGFEEQDGRCVPSENAPPFSGGGSGDGSPPTPDAATRPDQGPSTIRFDRVRLVDKTEPGDLRLQPETPGADIDAVVVDGPGLFAFGVSVEGEVGDPFGASIARDLTAAIGEPDENFVSLGGGTLTVVLDLPRNLGPGDVVTVWATEDPGALETYEVSFCDEGGHCEVQATGSGAIAFEVP